MGPTRKRSSIRARASASTSSAKLGPSNSNTESENSSIFPLARSKAATPGTKVHKRQQKHHALLTRLNKARPAPGGISKPLRRRRTGKSSLENGVKSEKLLSTLSSLVEALPASEAAEWEHTNATRPGAAGDEAPSKVMEVDGIKVRVSRPIKSLKSRPGAMKKRAKVEKAERERFGMNLAVLAGLGNEGTDSMEGLDGNTTEDHPGAGQAGEGTGCLSGRWQALRNYIKMTS